MIYTNLKIKEIDWTRASNFRELKDRPDIEGVIPDVIYHLQETRNLLNRGIVVSPNPKAIVAKDGHSPSSQHYLGRAIDWFPIANPYAVIGVLMKYNPWTGLGFYFDTTLNGNDIQMMIHTDLRTSDAVTSKSMWIRNKNIYPGKGYFNLGSDCNGDEGKFLNALMTNIKNYTIKTKNKD